MAKVRVPDLQCCLIRRLRSLLSVLAGLHGFPEAEEPSYRQGQHMPGRLSAWQQRTGVPGGTLVLPNDASA